ncbi:hypothetical protein B0H11DRAFT_1935618 [Mycena galericulata]|nr:hypothetical protein B0H11DRAFT_1935618 [Mycena galericulata]
MAPKAAERCFSGGPNMIFFRLHYACQHTYTRTPELWLDVCTAATLRATRTAPKAAFLGERCQGSTWELGKPQANFWSRLRRAGCPRWPEVPAGMQRSSYFLSLPMRYGAPVIAISMLLHLLISEHIPGADELLPPRVRWGYSALGIILVLALGAVSVLVLIANSFARQYRDIPPGFQLMGLSSAAIRLMCRRPEGDTDAHLFPVRIGSQRRKQGLYSPSALRRETESALARTNVAKEFVPNFN